MHWLRGMSLRARLLGILLVGIIFMLISKGIEWDHGISHDVGIAFIVAAILGIAVDSSLKTELAKDAFKATLGYILRPEFRNEVARITGYKFLCEEHILLVEIKLLEGHVVEVTSSMERIMRNITASPEKISNYLHIDDWGFENGPSEIINCELEFNGNRFIGKPVDAEPSRQKQRTKEVSIGPNETFKVFSKMKEFRRDNDVAYFHFGSPTTNPEIEVRAPSELDADFGFGTPDPVEKLQYAQRQRLIGMYFPHQAMRVRWWPKAAD